ncbi:hypothetical protein L1987_41419 [Smallanthus sonchifolius]|uniref:Uncharacterized protein n=1 Tax=Smallanthus sonchifolius TaxID=185202 RepID=A0ACB9GVD0_9ASTR|nr:hypothetical protein L1987_41419 [Smallanthus sonchifolius]
MCTSVESTEQWNREHHWIHISGTGHISGIHRAVESHYIHFLFNFCSFTDMSVEKETVKLDDDQLAELREIFRSFDRNNDGSLTQLELGSLLRSLGLTPSPDQLDALIQKADFQQQRFGGVLGVRGAGVTGDSSGEVTLHG